MALGLASVASVSASVALALDVVTHTDLVQNSSSAYGWRSLDKKALKNAKFYRRTPPSTPRHTPPSCPPEHHPAPSTSDRSPGKFVLRGDSVSRCGVSGIVAAGGEKRFTDPWPRGAKRIRSVCAYDVVYATQRVEMVRKLDKIPRSDCP